MIHCTTAHTDGVRSTNAVNVETDTVRPHCLLSAWALPLPAQRVPTQCPHNAFQLFCVEIISAHNITTRIPIGGVKMEHVRTTIVAIVSIPL